MLLEIMVTIYIIIIKKLSLTPRNIKTEIENQLFMQGKNNSLF